jgi:hypothetical protein
MTSCFFHTTEHGLNRAYRISLLFLHNRLKLELHPKKVSIATLAAGVDFLGWVHFFNHRLLRTTAKQRMFRTLQDNVSPATVASYTGMLTHGNTRKIQAQIVQG